MSDYISREMAKAFFTPQKGVTFLTPIPVTVESLLATIDNIPAADVRPVRRGKWIGTHDGFYYTYSCSTCGYEALYKENTKDQVCSEFCPNCGADMREES